MIELDRTIRVLERNLKKYSDLREKLTKTPVHSVVRIDQQTLRVYWTVLTYTDYTGELL